MRNPKAFKKWSVLTSEFKMTSWMGGALLLILVSVYMSLVLLLNWLFYRDSWAYFGLIGKAAVITLDFDVIRHVYSAWINLIFREGRFTFPLAFPPVWLLGFVIIYKLKKGAIKMLDSQHVRGATLKTNAEIAREMKKKGENGVIPIGPVMRIGFKHEVRHTGVFGLTGAGKSVFMKQALHAIRSNAVDGGKGIVYDPHGEYVATFYREGIDKIYNPLDVRGIKHSLFRELYNEANYATISSTLIPDNPAAKDPFWNITSRNLLEGGMRRCDENNQRTSDAPYNFFNQPRIDIYNQLIASKHGKSAALEIADDDKKTASILSVTRAHCNILRYMTGDDGFSIKEWIRDDTQKGWIFLTNVEEAKQLLKPILTLFLELAVEGMKCRQQDLSKRVYFFLDEFASLHKITKLITLLTECRKFGAAVILGAQGIGAIDEVYNENLRNDIVSILGNKIIFQLKGTNAKYFSQYIGEHQSNSVSEQAAWGANNSRDGGSVSYKKETEDLVMPSDLSDLRTFHCYVDLIDYGLTKSRIGYTSYPTIHKPFIIRPELILDANKNNEKITSDNSDIISRLFFNTFNKKINNNKNENDENNDDNLAGYY